MVPGRVLALVRTGRAAVFFLTDLSKQKEIFGSTRWVFFYFRHRAAGDELTNDLTALSWQFRADTYTFFYRKKSELSNSAVARDQMQMETFIAQLVC